MNVFQDHGSQKQIYMSQLISIIVPVYNTEKYLHKCLDSILAQSYTEWEAILIDDGSTDNSGNICDKYSDKDKRFRVIHQSNAGVSSARNTALNLANGSFVTFIDSDDYVSNNYIDLLLKPLISDAVDFTCCQINDIINGKISQTNYTIKGRLSGLSLKQAISKNLFYEPTTRSSGMPLFLCGKMFKKDLLQEGLKVALDTWYGEDQIALLSILYNSNACYVLTEPLYYYVHYSEQVTSKYRADKWDELYRLWTKLLTIDRENLVEHQLPYRMWLSSLSFYYDSFPYFRDYEEYEKMTKHIFESALLRKYVFSGFVKSIPKNRFEKLLFYLLKYKLYRLLYIAVIRIKKTVMSTNNKVYI